MQSWNHKLLEYCDWCFAIDVRINGDENINTWNATNKDDKWGSCTIIDAVNMTLMRLAWFVWIQWCYLNVVDLYLEQFIYNKIREILKITKMSVKNGERREVLETKSSWEEFDNDLLRKKYWKFAQKYCICQNIS